MQQPNTDQREISKFSQLANKWWDRAGEFKTLHDINPLRLKFIQERVPLLGKKVLDVGCGGGILTESLAGAGAEVTGIDAAEEIIVAARDHLVEGSAIQYLTSTAEAMATKHAAEYEVVTCLELLEHVPNPQSVVSACTKLVKPGGHVFFSTINRTPKAYAFAVLGAEYLLKLLPRGTHDYAKFIKPSELATFARIAGLEICEFMGFSYNPLTQQCQFTDDISVNYLVHCQL